jgi:uncharacterized membrane protein YhaH (DUF805 family)
MNFGQAIASGFSNYVNFSGRAARSEYWYWVLFYILAALVTLTIDLMIGMRLTLTIFSLAAFLPSLALNIRRLHDLDRTGWWVLLHFIPLVGAIILIIWFCTEGTQGPNRFGPDRLGELGHLSTHLAT